MISHCFETLDLGSQGIELGSECFKLPFDCREPSIAASAPFVECFIHVESIDTARRELEREKEKEKCCKLQRLAQAAIKQRGCAKLQRDTPAANPRNNRLICAQDALRGHAILRPTWNHGLIACSNNRAILHSPPAWGDKNLARGLPNLSVRLTSYLTWGCNLQHESPYLLATISATHISKKCPTNSRFPLTIGKLFAILQPRVRGATWKLLSICVGSGG